MRIVRLTDYVVFVVELDHDADGTEDFLAHDLHVRASVGEDCGPDEISLGTNACSAEVESCTVFLARVDVTHDALLSRVLSDTPIRKDLLRTYVILNLRDLRSLVYVCSKRIADLEGLGLRREFLQKFVVNLLVHKYTRPGAAALAMVPASFEVSIIKVETSAERRRTKHHELPN